MDGLGPEIRAAVAVMRKELRQLARYRINTSALVLLPVFQFLVPSMLLGAAFAIRGRAVGFLQTTGTDDVAAFFVLGALTIALGFGAFWGTGFSIRAEQMAGTLEPLWLVPTRPLTILAGVALAQLLLSLLGTVFLFVVAVVAFGSSQEHLLRALLALPLFLVCQAGLLGIAYLAAAAVLVAREPNALIDLGSFFASIAAGAQAPLVVLPAVILPVSLLLPTTYALDLARHVALGTRTLLPPWLELAGLVLVSAALLPLGAWVFTRAEHHVRTAGTLGQY